MFFMSSSPSFLTENKYFISVRITIQYQRQQQKGSVILSLRLQDTQHVLLRALCRIKLLPVTHVLVDTWTLTVKPVYKLLNVSDDLKWTTNTHNFYSLSRHNLQCLWFWKTFFLLLHFLPVHHISTRPY